MFPSLDIKNVLGYPNHFSSSSSSKNHEVFLRFLMIPSQGFGSDILHEIQGCYILKYTDQCYKMQGLHYEGLAWSKYEPSLIYCNPIQRWIEKTYECTSRHDYIPITCPCELDSVFGYGVMLVLDHHHFVLDISLFWFITKHKGRIFYFVGMLGWFH